MEHKIDRLSKLPEPILEHILSFIPLNQTLQLSLLSKTWKNVWALFPIPEITQDVVWSTLYSNNKAQRMRNDIDYFVKRTLLGRLTQKQSVKKFVLRMTIDESYCALVNRWIGYAIECNVKELHLLVCWYPHGFYNVPNSVMAGKSITELKVWGCKFKPFHSDINLSSLKKLLLRDVYMDDQIFETLIAGCPVVEEINVQHCHGLKNIHLSGLPKLMAFEVFFNPMLESIEIEASNLESLLIYLEMPCQINLHPCENLKNLALHSAAVTDKWLHHFLSKHPFIKSLDLHDCSMLKKINISSDRMKSLILVNCKKLVEVKIIAPNLHTLTQYGNANLPYVARAYRR
jgi:hypothetical protein